MTEYRAYWDYYSFLRDYVDMGFEVIINDDDRHVLVHNKGAGTVAECNATKICGGYVECGPWRPARNSHAATVDDLVKAGGPENCFHKYNSAGRCYAIRNRILERLNGRSAGSNNLIEYYRVYKDRGPHAPENEKVGVEVKTNDDRHALVHYNYTTSGTVADWDATKNCTYAAECDDWKSARNNDTTTVDDLVQAGGSDSCISKDKCYPEMRNFILERLNGVQ